jgi:hypothetical protein
VLADAGQGGCQLPGPRQSGSCQAKNLARQLALDTSRVSRLRGNASVMSAGSHHDKADAHELLR